MLRFLGLRLFMSLAAAGWAGYAQHVERDQPKRGVAVRAHVAGRRQQVLAKKPPRLWLHHHGEQNRQAALSRFGSENQNFPPL